MTNYGGGERLYDTDFERDRYIIYIIYKALCDVFLINVKTSPYIIYVHWKIKLNDIFNKSCETNKTDKLEINIKFRYN